MTMERIGLEYRPVKAASQFAEPPVYEPAADITRIVGVIRRQYKLALAGALLAGVLAVVFLMVIEPSYQSRIRILLDQDRTRLLTEIAGEQPPPASADEFIATQIAIISSDIVARRVIHNLELSYDADARRLRMPDKSQSTDTKQRLSRVTSEYLVLTETDPAVVAAVQRAISAYQVDKSLVIEITANDPDPEIAQKLATAYGQAYLTDQLSARFEATKSAGSWLEDRISTLRDQSLEANAAIEKFRAENDLVSTDGRLVSDQQLDSLNEQLVTTKLAVMRASAKVDVFKAAVEKNDVKAIIGIVGSTAEISDTAPIRSLRSDYLEVAGRARDVAARWGADNNQARVLQAEVVRQSGLVLDEARRILESYQSDLRTAQAEAEATDAAVASATGRSQADSSTLVTLRSLEQRSASYNALYQDYLARYQEAVQQQTLSLTTGRMISTAELPELPVFPNKKVIFAFMLLLGAGAGAALGAGREVLDRTFRARSEVERQGLDFLGYVAGPGSRKRRRLSTLAGASKLAGANKDTVGSLAALAEQIDRSAPALEAIRTGIEIRCRGAGRVVAMVSLEPSLSRPALALALAKREARSGRRVLLVDADGATRALSNSFRVDGVYSLADVLQGRVPLEEAAKPISERLRFLPSAQRDVASLIPAEQLKSWGKVFDLVVLDLPPAGPISAARALAPALDGCVCAVEWGKTPRQMLSALIQSSSNLENKMIGVVITDVNMNKQYLYDPEVAQKPRGHPAV
jgi:succinoglycan biosynthesis transport protein ExoP